MIEQHGRKFFLTVAGIGLMIILPVIYQKIGISDTTTQIVLGSIAAGIGTYGVTNVLADKYNKNAP